MSNEVSEEMGQEPLPETINYEKEFFALVKILSQLGLNMQVLANNTESRIQQVLNKQKSS